MEIKNLLNYKVQLMGLSAITILLLHFNVSDSFITLQRCFSWVVELFLILSGIGCYYSIQKRTIKQFLLKRILRIFPVYIVILIGYGWFCCSVGGMNPMDFTLHNEAFISLFGFGEITGWFLVAIILCYLLTPLFNKIANKQNYYLLWLTIGIIILSAQLEFYTTDSLYMVNNFVIVRIPAYLVGMFIGSILYKNDKITLPIKPIILGEIGCIILMILNFNLNTMNFGLMMKIINIPTAFFSSMIIVKLFSLTKYKFYILKFFGVISLECYLIYEKVLSIFIYGLLLSISVMEINLIAFCITTILAIILRFIFNLIINHKLSLF